MNDNADKLMSLFLYDQASMTPEQLQELSAWILQQPDNTRAFIRNALLHRNIHELFVRSDSTDSVLFSVVSQPSVQDSHALNPEIWRLLSEDEKTAPTVQRPEPKQTPTVMPDRPKIEAVPRRINKFSIASAIVSLAALLCIVTYLHFVPVVIQEQVATVTDMVDAQWAESGISVKKGSRICTNTEPMMLRKGIAKVLFDNNTGVVIEAPAEFVLISDDQVKLNYGRLYAVVPQEAIGFTVTTPNSKIIDLGTEFGVQVDFDESTQLHVVKGKTTLVADQEGRKVSLQVSEGAAKAISNRSQGVMDITCEKQLFVRDIRSERNLVWRGGPLQLADMLDGDNGFSLDKNGESTRTAARPIILETPKLEPGRYFTLDANPFIDGLFVPNGINGPVPVTADGQFSWQAPPMEVRQKIGYLRFDISQVSGNRKGAVLSLGIRKWAGKNAQIQVYGLLDGQADHWDEAQVTYNTAAGLLPAPMGRFRLDHQVLTDLGTLPFEGLGMQRSEVSSLNLDDFIAQDTNGLLTFVLVRQENDTSAEWTIRTKEDDTGSPPTLTFPYGSNNRPMDITTAVGYGADTYLSNDNQYDNTGPDDSHGTETVLKIRNYINHACCITNASQISLPDDAYSRLRAFMLNREQSASHPIPMLAMRTNSAMTFDLQAIRNFYTGIISIRSFTAACRPADVPSDLLAANDWQQPPRAGFYVLVDGRMRFSKMDMLPGQSPVPVTVELTPQDRYLTLVTTGGTDRKAAMDWGLFLSPQITIE